MGAIEILMSEHRVIERAIDALVAFTDQVRRGSGDKAELARFVTFIREFADDQHHGKEENVLFQAMIDAGFPRDGGPVAVMLLEHDMGRAHVKALAAFSAQASAWSAEDRQAIAEEGLGYANLLRGHIHKEDEILYPMAEQRLPRAVLSRVDADCAAFDEAESRSGRQARLQALAQELVSRHAAAPGGGATPPPDRPGRGGS
jgi:hemerythrin-like domain-containing protein